MDLLDVPSTFHSNSLQPSHGWTCNCYRTTSSSLTLHAQRRPLQLQGHQQPLPLQLQPLQQPLTIGAQQPTVIMVVGVNGAGKTTSIGKLTRHLADSGQTVLLAAADTFRAAAREQLAAWAHRNDAAAALHDARIDIVSQEGADPGAATATCAAPPVRSSGPRGTWRPYAAPP
jgi:ATPase subunit of ABC transporter with duplicated ATPase domains